jgi:uncharacterized protein (DUF488 family)
MQETVFTIGHSTQSTERFIELLRRHSITAIADVRSMPYSKMNPQFNSKALKAVLQENGIAYVFLGKELGARSADRSCYENGKVQYGRLAQTELFASGLERVREGAKTYRIALMCAEKEPLDCHRTILVSRHLASSGTEVRHIHGDGRIESHDDAMTRLIRLLHLPEDDMFSSRQDVLSEAYRLQGDRIAYTEEKTEDESVGSAAG